MLAKQLENAGYLPDDRITKYSRLWNRFVGGSSEEVSRAVQVNLPSRLPA